MDEFIHMHMSASATRQQRCLVPWSWSSWSKCGCSESNLDALKQQHMLFISEPSLHTSVCYLLILGTRTENFSEGL